MQRLIDDPSESDGSGDGISQDWHDWLQRLSSNEQPAETTGQASDTQSAGEEPHSFPLRIGRFELLSILGSGGFGIVFRAHDPQLDRDVALKILRPEAALSPRIQRRFLREATSVAQLEHPGIISVYDAGRQAGLSYLAAPLCEGPNLAAWMREHPRELSPRQVAELIAQVADAVQHAHARGIMHRDLKPSNILLKAAPLDGGLLAFQPLLTDFGLARRLDSAGDETIQGMILGTTAYMSPEQAAGRWKEVGVTSDVFSLGVVFYELLTGVRPFVGSSPDEVRQRIATAEPVPPRRICPATPPDLETICLKCLAKAPHDRYLSAGEMAVDLRRFLEHQPILARPPGMTRQLWLWCRRRPVIAALSLLLAVTLATSAAVTGALYRQERLERAQAEENLGFAREAVSKMYTKVADQWLIEQPEVQDLRREFLEDALKFYERIAAQQPHDERTRHDLEVAMHRMSNIAHHLGRPQQALVYRKRCLEIIEGLRRDFPENEAYQYDAFMSRLLLPGEGNAEEQRANRLKIMLEADEIIRALILRAPANPNYRDSLAALCAERAREYHLIRQTFLAQCLWEESVAISETLIEEFPDQPLRAKHGALGYAELALRRLEEGQIEEASSLFANANRLIENIRQQAPGARWTDEWAIQVQIGYAFALANRADMKEAVPLLEDCRDSLSRLIDWYPKTPAFRETRTSVCARLVDAYAQLDRPADSLAAIENAKSDATFLLARFPDHQSARSVLVNATEKLNSLTQSRGEPSASAVTEESSSKEH